MLRHGQAGQGVVWFPLIASVVRCEAPSKGGAFALHTVTVVPNKKRDPDERDLAGQDPEEVLRRLLAISPEEAAKARKDAKATKDSGEKGSQPQA